MKNTLYQIKDNTKMLYNSIILMTIPISLKMRKLLVRCLLAFLLNKLEGGVRET